MTASYVPTSSAILNATPLPTRVAIRLTRSLSSPGIPCERRVRDPLMGKTITRSRKFHAHVEEGTFGEGDLVEIAECRPISRTKSWKVTRLVEKSKAI